MKAPQSHLFSYSLLNKYFIQSFLFQALNGLIAVTVFEEGYDICYEATHYPV
jgi:hypothetical protein